MIYTDDILVVNAYLRSKMRKNIEATEQLALRIKREAAEYDALLQQSKSMLAEAQALSAQLGVDLSGIEAPEVEPPCRDAAELLISLPENYDFAKAFDKILQEAHAAGFVTAAPEDLLSSEEMARAEAFYEEVDARFEAATKLQGKDIFVMTVAVALRIICKVIFPLFKARNEAAMQDAPPNEVRWTAPPEAAAKEAPAAIDAFSGVDLGSLAKATKDFSSHVVQSDQMISQFISTTPKAVGIKGSSRILRDPLPFNVPDNEYFFHHDALGYNKWLGWLFGVLNIMTDTVTTSKMNTFSVIQSGQGIHPAVHERISTFVHLLLPVMTKRPQKEALLAAVVMEAGALNLTKAPPESVAALLSQTFSQEEKALSRIQQTSDTAQTASQIVGQTVAELKERFPQPVLTDPAEIAQKAAKEAKQQKLHESMTSFVGTAAHDTAILAFLNQLITAIHAMMYDPETDGPVEMYAIRTNSILTTAGVIATAFNSLDAILTQDPMKIDFAGVITSCVSLFNSTRFWVDVKSNYLFDAYRPGMEEQLSIVNKYFTFTRE